MTIVYQNIEESHYYFNVGDITFYFSSSFNRERFKNRYLEYITNEERKIINKYHITLDIKIYLLIAFYTSIEHRGFLVEVDKQKLKLSDINFMTKLFHYNEVR